MPKYKISPSTINLLQDCPGCFWKQIVKKIKRPSGAFPSLPSGVDLLLKKHFDKFRDSGKLPPELRLHKVDAKLFKDHTLLTLWRNNRKGIEYEEEGILLRGAVDEMLQKGKKLIVLDYKTRGFPLKEDTAAHYHDQLNIYNFLLRKNGFETEDYSYLLFFIPKEIEDDGDFVFHTELVKVKVDIHRAEDLLRKAAKVLNGRMPKAGKDCGFCEFKNGG